MCGRMMSFKLTVVHLACLGRQPPWFRRLRNLTAASFLEIYHLLTNMTQEVVLRIEGHATDAWTSEFCNVGRRTEPCPSEEAVVLLILEFSGLGAAAAACLAAEEVARTLCQSCA